MTADVSYMFDLKPWAGSASREDARADAARTLALLKVTEIRWPG